MGPLELWDHERQFELGSVKQRRVLGTLLHARGEPVSVETLVDRVWDAPPLPASPEASLQSYLSRLRRVLAEAVGDRVGIAHPSPGRYQLRFDPEDVDLLRFQRLRREAVEAAARGEREFALGKLHAAQAEWKGEPLAEFGCDWALSLRARLHEDLRHVQEERIRLELELGRHADLLGELQERAARHPLDQRGIASLMLALYRSGRTAEALRRYRDTRRLLRDSQGIEPDAELRELHERMLAQDDASLLPARSPEPERTAQPAP
ncbi:AfsR/SARP family transcriptional regulator, partial [Streptomyces boncukensis]|uniref:AfsR/SARP family transcriptional regulator n=1 Tax=Streptomyces boncukensis TaxID=2711219 RepID=UPI0019D24B0F